MKMNTIRDIDREINSYRVGLSLAEVVRNIAFEVDLCHPGTSTRDRLIRIAALASIGVSLVDVAEGKDKKKKRRARKAKPNGPQQ